MSLDKLLTVSRVTDNFCNECQEPKKTAELQLKSVKNKFLLCADCLQNVVSQITAAESPQTAKEVSQEGNGRDSGGI